jgi:hypothetical protein
VNHNKCERHVRDALRAQNPSFSPLKLHFKLFSVISKKHLFSWDDQGSIFHISTRFIYIYILLSSLSLNF